MLELETALEQILREVPPAMVEECSLELADRRILAENVTSQIDLPLFDNSMMDGYAVRSTDVVKASKDRPVRLKIVSKVAAGKTWAGTMAEQTCVRLFTGSPLPNGADAVVMQEDTKSDSRDFVDILEPSKPWENVRFQGEDIKKGALVAKQGERLNSATLMLLAATGSSKVKVGRQPTVALLATGSELVDAGEALSPGKIYESNRLGLASLVRRAGGVPGILPILADDPEATIRAVRSAVAECDIVITSGGVSVGEMDFVKPAVQQIGGSIEFWKVAIKPGRPFVFGKAHGKLLFGLPGNPVSAFVTFLLLVRPALLRWQGATDMGLPVSVGILAEPLTNDGRRRHFMRVILDSAGNVRSAGTQASHIFSSLAASNGLVEVAPETTLSTGTAVRVMRWE